MVQIDTRRTEASRYADEVLLLQPGSDAALVFALAQVILAERLYDQEFIEHHTHGFVPFVAHVRACTPEWAAAITGIEPERIRAEPLPDLLINGLRLWRNGLQEALVALGCGSIRGILGPGNLQPHARLIHQLTQARPLGQKDEECGW